LNATFGLFFPTVKNKRLAVWQAVELFGCGDLQPDLEAHPNQVIAKARWLRRASSRFFMGPLDLDSISLPRARAALISVSKDGNWIEYAI